MNSEKTKFIKESITQGVSQYGMQTFDQSLYFLYEKGLVTYDDALKYATNPEALKLKKIGVQSTKEMSLEEMEQRMSDIELDEKGGDDMFGDHNLLDLDEI